MVNPGNHEAPSPNFNHYTQRFRCDTARLVPTPNHESHPKSSNSPCPRPNGIPMPSLNAAGWQLHRTSHSPCPLPDHAQGQGGGGGGGGSRYFLPPPGSAFPTRGRCRSPPTERCPTTGGSASTWGWCTSCPSPQRSTGSTTIMFWCRFVAGCGCACRVLCLGWVESLEPTAPATTAASLPGPGVGVPSPTVARYLSTPGTHRHRGNGSGWIRT